MTARRWPGRDRGSFTVELAVGLPALLLLLHVGLSAVNAVTLRGRCVDAAREGAIIAARGGPGAESAARIAPPGARITVRLGPADPGPADPGPAGPGPAGPGPAGPGPGGPGPADLADARVVVVSVEADVPILGGHLPGVTVHADAVAAAEPEWIP